MKIAIAGAGIYGCIIAILLSHDFPKIVIHLFEKRHDICGAAATNNQHRVHKGFHYPKSVETVEQILRTYVKFKNKFGQFIKPVRRNYYAVEHNSRVSFREYVETFSRLNLKFKEVPLVEIEDFISTDLLEGCVITDEETFDLLAMADYFRQEISIASKIHLKLDTEFKEEMVDDYDLVINTTYTNPNLGLRSPDKQMDVKYEICLIPVVENIFKDDICFTVMDGDFVSGYQDSRGNLTLSSVKYTPYYKTGNLLEFEERLHRDQLDISRLEFEVGLIIDHCSKYFKFLTKDVIIKNVYFSPKVKIRNDINNCRKALLVEDGKVVSILCAKITAVMEIYDYIKTLVQ